MTDAELFDLIGVPEERRPYLQRACCILFPVSIFSALIDTRFVHVY